MSWSKQTTLWCDGGDCSTWKRFTTAKVTEARKKCEERHGWGCSQSQDLCNDCKQDTDTEQ